MKHPWTKAERNMELYRRFKDGERIVNLAKAYAVTPGRIGQIVEKERRFEYGSLTRQ